MKTIKGNLIDLAENGTFNMIVHGANCHHCMGAGVAREIRERYPEAAKVDKFYSSFGDINKLGTFTRVWQSSKKPFVIVNMYTQFDVGPNADIEAIQKGFENIKKGFDDIKNFKIGIPKIGCGLGGLKWEDVEKVIDEVMFGYDITVVEFEK